MGYASKEGSKPSQSFSGFVWSKNGRSAYVVTAYRAVEGFTRGNSSSQVGTTLLCSSLSQYVSLRAVYPKCTGGKLCTSCLKRKAHEYTHNNADIKGPQPRVIGAPDLQTLEVVGLSDGLSYPAEIVGLDAASNLAVISVEADPVLLHPVVVSSIRPLKNSARSPTQLDIALSPQDLKLRWSESLFACFWPYAAPAND